MEWQASDFQVLANLFGYCNTIWKYQGFCNATYHSLKAISLIYDNATNTSSLFSYNSINSRKMFMFEIANWALENRRKSVRLNYFPSDFHGSLTVFKVTNHLYPAPSTCSHQTPKAMPCCNLSKMVIHKGKFFRHSKSALCH